MNRFASPASPEAERLESEMKGVALTMTLALLPLHERSFWTLKDDSELVTTRTITFILHRADVKL